MGNLSIATPKAYPLFPTLFPLESLLQPLWPVFGVPLAPLAPPVQAAPQDKVSIMLQGAPVATVPFVDSDPPVDLATARSEIRAISDPAARAEKYRDVLADLIEDKNIDGALALCKEALADQVLPQTARNNMYHVITRNLLELDLHDKAIELNGAYPDPKVRDEVRKDIVDYLIAEGQTIKAAQVKGEGNLTGVAKAELERLGKSAKILGKDIYEFWHHTVIGETLGERIAENALDDAEAGKKYRQASLNYGTLACAYTVSRILDRTRVDDTADSAECNTLASQLKKSGFTQVGGDRSMKPVSRNFEYKPGDIIFFTRKNKAGYGHVAVIAKVEGDKVWMVHNSSAKRQVVQAQLNTYQRPVVGVLRPPEK